MNRAVAVPTVSVALTGCVTTQLTPKAQMVRVTSNPEAVRGCTLIGNIDASDRLQGGMMGQMAAEENANRRLQNKAAEAGAKRGARFWLDHRHERKQGARRGLQLCHSATG